MAARFSDILRADFDRAFNECFEELLIEPWRRASVSGGAGEVCELPDRYEVRLAGVGNPDQIAVEVTNHRLTVRIAAPGHNATERTVEFASAIDCDHVTAHWSKGTLIVVLPRRGVRRVPLG